MSIRVYSTLTNIKDPLEPVVVFSVKRPIALSRSQAVNFFRYVVKSG